MSPVVVVGSLENFTRVYEETSTVISSLVIRCMMPATISQDRIDWYLILRGIWLCARVGTRVIGRVIKEKARMTLRRVCPNESCIKSRLATDRFEVAKSRSGFNSIKKKPGPGLAIGAAPTWTVPRKLQFRLPVCRDCVSTDLRYTFTTTNI